MPIYEYHCNACGHHLETLQKMSEAPLKTCPACGADTLVKEITAAAFQLKGSGWYETDFRGKSGGNAGSKSSTKSAAPPPCGQDCACHH